MTDIHDQDQGPVWTPNAGQSDGEAPAPTAAPTSVDNVWTEAGPAVSGYQPTPRRGPGRAAGIAIVAAFALIAVTAVGAFALSQNNNGSSSGAALAANSSSSGTQALAGNASDDQALCQSLLKNLASQFTGGDTAKLQQGFVAAADATIDQAVKDGKITSAQGQAMKDRLAQMPSNACALMPMMGRGWMGRDWTGEGQAPEGTPNPNATPNPNGNTTPNAPGIRGFGFGFLRGGAVMDALAKSLGITTAQLRTEIGQLTAGQGICTLAQNQGANCDTVKSAVRSAFQSDLNSAVSAGRITQQTADAALKAFDSWLASGGTLPQFRMGPGMGGFGGGMFPDFGGDQGGSNQGGSGQGPAQNG